MKHVFNVSTILIHDTAEGNHAALWLSQRCIDKRRRLQFVVDHNGGHIEHMFYSLYCKTIVVTDDVCWSISRVQHDVFAN